MSREQAQPQPPTRPPLDFENGCAFCGHRSCPGNCCDTCSDPRCANNAVCPECVAEAAALVREVEAESDAIARAENAKAAVEQLDEAVRADAEQLQAAPASMEPNTAYVVSLPASASRRHRAAQAQIVSALRDAGCDIVLMGKGGRLS